MTVKNPIVIPLDMPTLDDARRMLDLTAEAADIYKIGKQLFTAEGPAAIRLAQSYGKRVFLDLKYHDIPNTVAEAVRSASRHGVWMTNIHVSGGRKMLEAAARSFQLPVPSSQLPDGNSLPLLIGVTVLTSLDESLWTEVLGKQPLPLAEQVVRMARLAQSCGLNGVVASPREISTIREACGREFVIVTPGVRPAWAEANDQARTMTPGEAVLLGADYLVIGRPITAAENPTEAARRVLEEVEQALA